MFLNFFKKNWQNFVFNIILVLVFIFGYGRFGDIFVDSFREAYIPSQILNGQVLYKDIFTIYAPFSYLFNSLLFVIFGVKLKVLYFAGFAATAGILNLLYKISNKFTAKTYGLAIILFIISACVLSPNVFNFIFPYSYGVLYGLLFILSSIYFGLNKKFLLAYLMYSFAVCSKYEFIFLLPVLFWMEGWTSFKNNWVKNLLCLLVPVLLVFTPLFIMGMNLENLIVSIQLLGEMSKTKTLNWFYSISGLVWSVELLPIYLKNFLIFLTPILLIKKFNNWFAYLCGFVFLFFTVTPAIFIFLFPLILILFCINYKKLSKNKKFLVLSAIFISLKVFFASNMQSYGVFFIPLGILSLSVLYPPKLKKQFFAVLLMITIISAYEQIKGLTGKNIKISNDKGIVYVSEKNSAVKDVINYINSEKLNGTVAVYPECLAINFFTDTKSDNKFYSLIPLYVETFGDKIITYRINLIKPKYIIISNYDTSNYYFSEFGKDYATGTYQYIIENYTLEKVFEGGVTFVMYRLKTK